MQLIIRYFVLFFYTVWKNKLVYIVWNKFGSFFIKTRFVRGRDCFALDVGPLFLFLALFFDSLLCDCLARACSLHFLLHGPQRYMSQSTQNRFVRVAGFAALAFELLRRTRVQYPHGFWFGNVSVTWSGFFGVPAGGTFRPFLSSMIRQSLQPQPSLDQGSSLMQLSGTFHKISLLNNSRCLSLLWDRISPVG